jgi:MFS family permease
MGFATVAIGILPGFAAIGVAAPVLLTVLRVVQSIGVSGERGGSVLMAMEWGSTQRRGLMASQPQLGVPLGLLLSTAMVKICTSISGAEFKTWAGARRSCSASASASGCGSG